MRVPAGAFIVQQNDLRGVIGHLHDLARHLEGLIPADTDVIETLERNRRTIAEGFGVLAERERELDREVLEALSTRSDGARYESLSLEGYSDQQIEAAVFRLWKAGFVDAHSNRPKMVVPATLTTKGLRQLAKITTSVETVGAR